MICLKYYLIVYITKVKQIKGIIFIIYIENNIY